MGSFLFWFFLFVFSYSALIVATKRENRWGVLACWANSISAAAVLAYFGMTLLGVLVLITATLSAIPQFFIADTFGAPDFERPKKERYQMVFPAMMSALFAALVVEMLNRTVLAGMKRVHELPLSGGLFSKSAFIAVEILILFSFSAVIGIGVLTRKNKGESHG